MCSFCVQHAALNISIVPQYFFVIHSILKSHKIYMCVCVYCFHFWPFWQLLHFSHLLGLTTIPLPYCLSVLLMNFDLWIRKPPSNKSVHKSISLEWIHFSAAACTFLTDFYCVYLFVFNFVFFSPRFLLTPLTDWTRCSVVFDFPQLPKIVLLLVSLALVAYNVVCHIQLATATTIQSNQHTTWFYTFLRSLGLDLVLSHYLAYCRRLLLLLYSWLVHLDGCRAAGLAVKLNLIDFVPYASPLLASLLVCHLLVCTKNFWFINNNSFSNATHIPQRPVSLLDQLVCHASPRLSSFLANRHSMRCVR